MSKIKSLALIPLVAGVLFGCSGNEDLYAPVEAPEIESRFDIDKLWSSSVGGVGDFYSQLSPAFSGGIIYAAGRDGDVYAYDAVSGDRIWHTDLDDEEENDDRRSARLAGGVTVYAGKLAIGSENGYIYVLNAKDGSLLWKDFVGGEVIAKPAFAKSGTALFVLDSRGRLTSYSSDDGSVNWESGDALTDLRLRSQSDPLVIGDEYVLLGQSNGKVNVILQSTGSIVNQIDVGEPYGANALERVADVSATPLVIGSTLYSISYGGGLVQYSFENNQVLSRLNYQSSKDLAIDDSSIVIVGDNGHVYCLNRSDNSERWVNTVLTYRSVSAPAIYGDYVVVGDLDGYLYFMSLNDGTIVCQHEVDDSAIYTAPLVADGNLYVSTRDGDLTAYKYDPNGNAMVKELAVNELLDYAGAAVNMSRPGVGEGGIYAPSVMDKDQLQARRAAILRAAAEAEARQKAAIAAQRRAYEERRRAYEAQKRAYEERVREYKARVAAYEEEQRRRLSGFGLMPGVKSNADAVPEEPAPEAPKAPEVSAPETPVQEVPEMNMPKENPEEKASGFGL